MANYYKAYATNTAGTTYGNEQKVTTDISLNNKDFKTTVISISPNPTSGILNITVVEKANYSLLSVGGQVLKTGILAEGEEEINILYLPKGVYLLNIKTSKGSFTKKVVKN